MEKHVYEEFYETLTPDMKEFIGQLHELFMENGCTVDVELKKSGYVVSYRDGVANKILVNYVSRKKGMLARIYADNTARYPDFIDTLPLKMKKEIEKAPICKRLHDPEACNSKCSMGYIFDMDGKEYKKCRFNSFMFLMEPEAAPFIKDFLEKEVKNRIE